MLHKQAASMQFFVASVVGMHSKLHYSLSPPDWKEKKGAPGEEPRCKDHQPGHW